MCADYVIFSRKQRRRPRRMNYFLTNTMSDSKNVFVLVLAHLEPELELFEIDDVGDDGVTDL